MNTSEIIDTVGAWGPGRSLSIKDLTRTDGSVHNITALGVGEEWYGEAKQESFNILDQLKEVPQVEGMIEADVTAAIDVLKSRYGQSRLTAGIQGPSVVKLEDGVMLQRAVILAGYDDWDPPKKKPAAVMVQKLGARLNLPILKFVARIKLVEGKCGDITRMNY